MLPIEILSTPVFAIDLTVFKLTLPEASVSQYFLAILTPSFSSDKINKLRIDLIKEELDELQEAMKNNDLLEVADALTDILYVTYGAGHAFGVDLDKCFNEVQNSNMSKLDENGEPIYNESGKVMKGPNYFKPDLTKFVS